MKSGPNEQSVVLIRKRIQVHGRSRARRPSHCRICIILLTLVRGLQVRLATASSLPAWLSVPIAAADHRALGSAMPSATGTNSNRLPRSRRAPARCVCCVDWGHIVCCSWKWKTPAGAPSRASLARPGSSSRPPTHSRCSVPLFQDMLTSPPGLHIPLPALFSTKSSAFLSALPVYSDV